MFTLLINFFTKLTTRPFQLIVEMDFYIRVSYLSRVSLKQFYFWLYGWCRGKDCTALWSHGGSRVLWRHEKRGK